MRRWSILAAVLTATAAGTTWAQAPADPVVATVDGTAIKRSEVEATLRRLPAQYRQMPLEQIFDPLVERVIDSKLLVAEAKRRELEQQPAVQAEINRARDDVLRGSLVEQAVTEGATEERLQGAYNAMKTQPGFASEETQARHILVATEDEAKKIIEELGSGADFAELAKARSTDPSAKQNGGDLGYFRREAMVPEFSQVAFTAEPGKVAVTPVKSQFGWHVVEVLDRRQAVPTFAEKEPEIREQVAREVVEAMVADVRGKAEVERFNLDGSPKTP